jgi:hypothetical protein
MDVSDEHITTIFWNEEKAMGETNKKQAALRKHFE